MATNSVRTTTVFFALFTLATLSVQSVQCCDLKEIKKNAKNVSDVVCDKGVGRIYLKYDPVQRKIWLEGANKKINQTVLRLDKNANPELVGAEGSIRFVPKQIVRQDQADYIGLIVAERSTRGSGGGQCGSGSEEYFVAYKLIGTLLKERHRSLIQSCKKDILMDVGDGNNNDFSVRFDGDAIVFKWLAYPGAPAEVIGRYFFSANKLETINIE